MPSLNTQNPSLLRSQPIRLDHSAPGTVFRVAALVESAFNILGGTIMIAFPHWCLSWMSNTTPDVAVSVTQWLGALTLGLTPQLLLSAQNSRTALESRQIVYVCLLAGEGFLVPMMLWQAGFRNGQSGFSPRALGVACGVLGATALWRCWVLLVRPEWFGRYSEEQAGRKTSDQEPLLNH